MEEERRISSFTQDLLERESQSEEQRERREERMQKHEYKVKVTNPARQRKARSRRRAVLVLVLFVALAAGFTVRAVQKMISLSQERSQVQAQLEQLEKHRSELENELLQVNSDEYVEQQARSQLHMIRPGEVLYIVPNNTEYNREDDTEDPLQETPPAADPAKP